MWCKGCGGPTSYGPYCGECGASERASRGATSDPILDEYRRERRESKARRAEAARAAAAEPEWVKLERKADLSESFSLPHFKGEAREAEVRRIEALRARAAELRAAAGQ